MSDNDLRVALRTFQATHRFHGKGPLCVALVVTQHAKDGKFPLDAGALVTTGGGQVRGLGKSAVQAVLKRHGIHRILAAEGGRTSRGSLRNMRKYVTFLNGLVGEVDFDDIERYWVDQVKAFFAAKPFKIRFDMSRSLGTVIRDVIDQAEKRQRESIGTHYAGAVLQHLVGAKLDCSLGEGKTKHNSFSTADLALARVGDFFLGDVAIHVTTSPSEALIDRCRQNLNDGIRPVLVTIPGGLLVAKGLAKNKDIADRIDMFDIEQFIAINIYEIGNFQGDGRTIAMRELVTRYNEIIEEWETDPSLKIEIRR